ncbi:MAG: NADH-quinone oxidoreductase subunit M [Chloroflexi bacterium]|nr:NADH-quinone oxidoreductase subunit M [Chloroflexota bacterium]
MISVAGWPLLSVLIFLPALAGLALFLVPRAQVVAAKGAGLVVAAVTLLLSIVVAVALAPAQPGPQLEDRAAWVPSLGISYHVAVDGISVWLVVLTTLLTVIAMVAGWNRLGVGARDGFNLMLLLEAGVLGALLAQDLVLFFVLWEAMLVPMYLIIGLLGGDGRVRAALKFFLYTTFGSLVMLVGIIATSALHQAASGILTFDLHELASQPVSPTYQGVLFLAFALAFAIKVPLVPLHTWLPETYSQTPLSVLVLGTMLVKVGAYGFLRFCFPLFPAGAAQFGPLLSTLAVISILYGWFAAFGQRDLVRLIAYTSIAHMGFVVLGAFAFNHQGMQGSVLQMVNHGISTGALFLVAAALIDRTGSAELGAFGGLGARYPIFFGVFLVTLFSSVGLPGLNGFVGEFLVLLGAYQATPAFALVAVLGVVLAAIVLLWMCRLTMQGPTHGGPPATTGPERDLTGWEGAALGPLVVLIVALGLFPNVLLMPMEATVGRVASQVQAARQQAARIPPLAWLDRDTTTTRTDAS